MGFSVLISIYEKECPEFLERALLSIWDDQLLKPNQIVVVEDGPLPPPLHKVLENWGNKLGDIFERVSLSKNVGLGAALSLGLRHCSHVLVARMDGDDISLPSRFKQQVAFMNENPEVSVCGGWIKEFSKSPMLKGECHASRMRYINLLGEGAH